MKFTKESILKSLNSLTMPAWIKRVFQLIVDYIDDAAASVANPYQWYATHGGTIKDQSNFESINAFLYDRTYIIDKALLNSTITDTSIQNSIKTANILVVKDSTDNNYTLYIRGVVNTDELFFYNIDSIISTSINVKRIKFEISTNVLSANTVNAQFAKVIDMPVTQ